MSTKPNTPASTTNELLIEQGDIVYVANGKNAMPFVFDSFGLAEEETQKIPVFGYALSSVDDGPTGEMTYGICVYIEDQKELMFNTAPLDGFLRNLNIISRYLKGKLDVECLINFSRLIWLESQAQASENEENKRL